MSDPPVDPMIPTDPERPNGREPMLPSEFAKMGIVTHSLFGLPPPTLAELAELANEAEVLRKRREEHDAWRRLYFGDFTFHPISIFPLFFGSRVLPTGDIEQ